MRLKKFFGVAALGEIALLLLAWGAISLLFAGLFATAWRLFGGDTGVLGYFWQGLLWVFPLGLSYLAGQKLPHLWQYLLFAVLLCALGWVLFSTPYAMVPVGLLCFFRGRARLAEEPEASALEAPPLPLVFFFFIPFLTSAVLGSTSLQKMALWGGALYFFVWSAYRGLLRIYSYLYLNKGMAALPAKRILRMSGVGLGAVLLVAAGLLFPVLARYEGLFRIEPATVRPGATPAPVAVAPQGGGENMEELLQGMAGKPWFQIPPFLNDLLLAAACLAIALGLACGVYRIFRRFRGNFNDKEDVVSYLEPETAPLQQGKRQRAPLLDFSPAARVRRKYRRTILRATKIRPSPWASPQEIEATAGLAVPALHAAYEKARYGETEK